jgi:hyperosmotically inducible protein
LPSIENPIAAALAAGLGATAATRAGSGDSTAPQPRSDVATASTTDTAITAQVKAKFMSEDRLKGSEIGVTTTNGVVALSGNLANSQSLQIAVELAKGVDGVKSVDTSALSSSGG